MITFSPIHKKIQKTLYEKINMLRKAPKSVIGTPITDGAEPDKNYMFSRTVWIKATSFTPVPTNPDGAVILMGGELDKSGHLKSGFKDTSTGEGHAHPHENKGLYSAEGEMPFRTLPGIKEVSVEYKGGGMKLGATRTATMSWTCWTWEDLDRLMQHFLHHGKTVLLEWGWNGGEGTLLDVKAYPATKKNDKNELIFDKDRCNKLITDLPKHILEQNGHYDAVCGLIQDFTWSVRDDGGFDCETTLISPGVTALQQHFKADFDDNMKFLPTLFKADEVTKDGEVDGMTFKSPEDNPDQWKGVTDLDDETIQEGWEDDDFWADTNQTIPNSAFKDLSPYFNFKSYMASFPEQLQANYIKNSQVSGDSNTPASIIRPKPFDWNKLGGGDKGWKVSIGGGPGIKGCQCSSCLETSPQGDFNVTENEFYCTWGWFEDNVLSRFFSSIGEKNQDKVVIGKFRSIEYTYDKDTGEITNYESVKIRNAKRQYTTDPLHWLLIKDDPLSNAVAGAVSTPLHLFSPKEDSSENQRKYGVCKSNEGFLRNIYFRGSYLAKKMVHFNTMEDAVMAVWDDFSSKYGDCYDFKIEFADDGNQVMLRDTGYASNTVKGLLNTAKTNEFLLDGTEGPMDGLFTFPIWQDGSIVKSQNLSAKLPDRMQIAAMYGSNNESTADVKNVKGSDNHSATAFGQIFAPTSGSGGEGLTYDQEQARRYSDLNTGGLDFPSKRNRSFGNSDGNPQDKIHVGANDGNQATPGDGTIVYPSILKMITVMQKKEMSDRLNAEGYFHQDAEGNNEETDVSKTEALFDRAKAMLKSNDPQGIENWYTWGNDGAATSILAGKYYYVKSDGTVSQETMGSSNLYTLTIDRSIHAVMKSHLRGDGAGLSYQSDPLVPLELEMEIDGTGGIFMGNTFQSSYLPVKYRNISCFQVKGCDHKISADGWTTTVKGQIRVHVPPPVEKEEVVEYSKTESVALRTKSDIRRVTTQGPAEVITKKVTLGTPIYIDENASEADKLFLDQNDDGILDSSVTEMEMVVGYTTARDNTGVDLGEFEFGNKLQFNEDGTIKTVDVVTNIVQTDTNLDIAERITNMDSHWETSHLTEFASKADTAYGNGAGADFLNWFNANQNNSNVIETFTWWTDHGEIGWAYDKYFENVYPNNP